MTERARGAILIVSLTWSACLFGVTHVAAEEGACGLAAGIWATPKQACQYAHRPNEAAALFGDTALLEWGRGTYRYQGVTCGIFSYQAQADQCTLHIECERAMGSATIELHTSEEFRFGTGPQAQLYYRCDIPADAQ
jgi:hypothetical protein